MTRILLACVLAAASDLPLSAQVTTRLSNTPAGAQANQDALHPWISGDGRFVVFESAADNLVAGDTNANSDVFRLDLVLGTIECASVDSSGAPGNLWSGQASIPDDGMRVVFLSAATSLVAGDTNGQLDVFLHDFSGGQTRRVSVAPGGVQLAQASSSPVISADGQHVAFASASSLLVPGDTNGNLDVFVVDLSSGWIQRASVGTGGVQGNQDSDVPALSADGRWVAFQSPVNFVAGDTNFASDVFVHDCVTGTTLRASVDSAGLGGVGASASPSLSADGRCVAFASRSQLAAADLNGYWDVYVRDLVAGTTELASVGLAGGQSGGDSTWPSLSADGRLVAFESLANALVGGDTNLKSDVFLHDRVLGTTLRASLRNDGGQGNGESTAARLSSDGRTLVFQSGSDNLVGPDANLAIDVFARSAPVQAEAFCFGDGSQPTACPCSNFGFPGNGCDNSLGTGGANLTASGAPLPDSIVLSATGELPSSLSIFLQGDLELGPGTWFGDGVRCVGGALKRLYSKNAVNGSVSAPGAGELGVRARSTQLGDAIPIGSTRSYQVYYRDPDASFCTPPFGNTWNVSNGVRIRW